LMQSDLEVRYFFAQLPCTKRLVIISNLFNDISKFFFLVLA
jgi:hypothetical protein